MSKPTYNYKFQNPDLPVGERVADLISQLTVDEKIGFLATHQFGVERLGVNDWGVGTEVARGYVGREPPEVSTVFPQPIGMSSTFDTELMYALGIIAGTEARIYNQTKYPNTKLMLWGPTVDPCRNPLWGRNEEGYGEDPCLTGLMSTSYTRGMRGNDDFYLRVVPTLKHFCANNHEEERGVDSANLEPRTKREYYYAAFEASVRAKGAFAMMTAYNELSGVPGLNNPDLQTVCKDEWGLGFVVTDGGDFCQNVLLHHYDASHAESLAAALKAGNDIMTDSADTVRAAALDALRLGLLTEADLDKTIANSLLYRFRLGEFDPKERNPYADISPDLLDCPSHRAINHRAAKEAVTLLKNNGILPLDKGGIKKIAVIGELAADHYPDWYTGTPSYNISILDGLKDVLGADQVVYDDGRDKIALRSVKTGKRLSLSGENISANGENVETFTKTDWNDEILFTCDSNGKMIRNEDNGIYAATGTTTFQWFVRETLRPASYCGHTLYKSWNRQDVGLNEDGLLSVSAHDCVDDGKLFDEEILSDGAERAAEAAKDADAVIVCLGNDPMMNARECYDRKTLALNPHQQKLIDTVSAANKNVIQLVIASYPYSIVKENENLPAVIYTAHGGPEMGAVIAKTLFGEYNPAGRTCQTWYKSELDLPSIKDYDIIDSKYTYLYFNGTPLYPFGHGLSYSNFEYGNFTAALDDTAFDNENTDGKLNFNVDITNTSATDGEEVVQIYASLPCTAVNRPHKWLIAFKRVFVPAGQTVSVELTAEKEALRYWNVDVDRFCVEDGDYLFSAAASSADVRQTAKLKVPGYVPCPRNLRVRTPAVRYNRKKGVAINWNKRYGRHYVKCRGWSGEMMFDNADVNGITGFEATVSIDSGKGKIELQIGEDKALSAVAEVPPCADPTQMFTVGGRFEEALSGCADVKLTISGGVNVLEFRLI
jgi:beta-glucosidase